jgi:TetR/AcrR family transcriptional regulator, cholesterol catabolism regulator
MPKPSSSRALKRTKAEPATSTRTRAPVRREATNHKLDAVLAAAASLIAEKGFEATSMRDVAGALEVSLAGLYHYFKSKEDLLYQIQYKTFASLLAAQEEASALPATPEERLRRLVVGHLGFFTAHPAELKVCTYETASLTGDHYHTTEGLRRRYYRLMSHVLAELMGEASDIGGESRSSRHAALYVFGMLNWIFMWYDPARHGEVREIGDEMIDLVLHGVQPRAAARATRTKNRP